mmetsp:Transcript_23115/g.71471  ORF Transcript_23115/g.71471 Transcript_23115/m.71471 type:complete len:307 (+) Transcript_23115:397-1317(+)
MDARHLLAQSLDARAERSGVRCRAAHRVDVLADGARHPRVLLQPSGGGGGRLRDVAGLPRCKVRARLLYILVDDVNLELALCATEERWQVVGVDVLREHLLVVLAQDGDLVLRALVDQRAQEGPHHAKGGRRVDHEGLAQHLWVVLLIFVGRASHELARLARKLSECEALQVYDVHILIDNRVALLPAPGVVVAHGQLALQQVVPQEALSRRHLQHTLEVAPPQVQVEDGPCQAVGLENIMHEKRVNLVALGKVLQEDRVDVLLAAPGGHPHKLVVRVVHRPLARAQEARQHALQRVVAVVLLAHC